MNRASTIITTLRRVLTPKRCLWAARLVILIFLIAVIIRAWSSFFVEEWDEPMGIGDYLPLKLTQGDVIDQPFNVTTEGLSDLSLSFDPPVTLKQPDQLLLTLTFFDAGSLTPLYETNLTGHDINPYSSTLIPMDVKGTYPGQTLMLRLTVDQLSDQDLLSIHTVFAVEDRMQFNGMNRGLSLGLLTAYTRFDTVGMIIASVLLALIIFLLFVPLRFLKRVFDRLPFIPVLLTSLILVVIVEMLNALNKDAQLPFTLVILSFLFILLLQMLLAAMIRNDRIALYIGSFIVIGLAYGNHSKQFFRGDPLFAGDIVSLPMLMATGLAQLQFKPSVRFLIAMLLVAVLAILLTYARSRGLFKTVVSRAAASASVLLLVFLLASQIVLNDTLMITRFNVAKYPWNQMMNYGQNGFVVPFVGSIRDLFIKAPVAKEPIPEDFYLAPQQKSEPDPDQPNIIVIMSESFSDLGHIKDLKASESEMPYFNQLRNSDQTIDGYMLSPVFGGGTCNTEFEFLTGGSMIFFHDSSIPYMSYFRKPVHSVPDLLSQQGYRSVAIHPYLRSFWNRQVVYPAMGFDEFISMESFPEDATMINFISDQADYEMIVDQLQSKTKEERLFIFSVTMQNHFPYYGTDENFEQLEYHITLPDYADAESVELYLSMLRHSDDALKYLIEQLEALDEPTMLVFFGDHLPGRNKLFEPFYEAHFGKPMSDLNIEETMKLYETPYLIWANYELPEIETDASRLSPNFLSQMMLSAAGVERSPYFDYINSLSETIEAVSTTTVTMRNGRVYDRESIPQSIVRQLDRYWAYQYDNIVKPIEP